MTHIIGDSGKRKYNRDLARRLNEEAEREAMKETLDEKLEKEPEKPAEVAEQAEEKTDEGLQTKLDLICRGFEDMLNLKINSVNEAITKYLDSISIRLYDIYDFSQMLGTKYVPRDNYYHPSLYSHYLNVLMRLSKDHKLKVDLINLNEIGFDLDGIGARLEDKRLEIVGNVGEGLARGAIRSEFFVHGNAGEEIGDSATHCQIHLMGEYGGLAKKIGEKTEIYHHTEGHHMIQIHPRISWKRYLWNKITGKW